MAPIVLSQLRLKELQLLWYGGANNTSTSCSERLLFLVTLRIAVLNPTGSDGQHQNPNKFVRTDDHVDYCRIEYASVFSLPHQTPNNDAFNQRCFHQPGIFSCASMLIQKRHPRRSRHLLPSQNASLSLHQPPGWPWASRRSCSFRQLPQ